MKIHEKMFRFNEWKTKGIEELLKSSSMVVDDAYSFTYHFEDGTMFDALVSRRMNEKPIITGNFYDKYGEPIGNDMEREDFFSVWTAHTDTDTYKLTLMRYKEPCDPIGMKAIYDECGNFHLYVPSKHGTMDVTVSGDLMYPGVDIELLPEKEPENESDLITNPRILFEWPFDRNHPQIMMWQDAHDEDYTSREEFTNHVKYGDETGVD